MKLLQATFIIVIFLMLSLQGFSQVRFEEGYFINNENEKIECLIQNKDWKNNPRKFKYMLSPNAEALSADIKHVKEFGISNRSKYMRVTVNIDRSSTNLKKLSSDRNPEWQEETLFLLVLLEGPATLYLYEETNFKRFFYQINDSETEQLIYKKYMVDDVIGENKAFLGQLNYALNCDENTQSKLATLKYTENGLRNYFLSFNKCTGTGSVVYKNKSENKLNFKIRPGLNSSTFTLDGYNGLIISNFERSHHFRLGMEAELILPFNNNKWSFFAEPSYQHFKAEGSNEGKSHVESIVVDFKYIDFALGLRHYFFLNEKSRLFINGAVVLNFNQNPATVKTFTPWSSNTLQVQPFHNFALGAGFSHNRISTELRYFTSEDITWKYTSHSSSYQTMSLIFGYKLF